MNKKPITTGYCKFEHINGTVIMEVDDMSEQDITNVVAGVINQLYKDGALSPMSLDLISGYTRYLIMEFEGGDDDEPRLTN